MTCPSLWAGPATGTAVGRGAGGGAVGASAGVALAGTTVGVAVAGTSVGAAVAGATVATAAEGVGAVAAGNHAPPSTGEESGRLTSPNNTALERPRLGGA